MTIMKIYVAPHPVLKTPGNEVSKVDDNIRRLMDDMLETMYVNDGIGLAAPQIGVSQRILVLDVDQPRGEDLPPEQRRGKPQFFINPEIMWSSEERRIYNEGCLSIPAQYAEIERPDKVRVKYLDYEGKAQETEAGALLSTCLQHEIDHLNGILFIDHLSGLKRDIILRRLKKFTKENAEDLERSHVL